MCVEVALKSPRNNGLTKLGPLHGAMSLRWPRWSNPARLNGVRYWNRPINCDCKVQGLLLKHHIKIPPAFIQLTKVFLRLASLQALTALSASGRCEPCLTTSSLQRIDVFIELRLAIVVQLKS
jgi:hypothetical protein